MPRRLSPRFVRNVTRRATIWSGPTTGVSSFTQIAAATSQIDSAFTEALLQEVVPATIIRVIGELWVRTDQLIASESPFGALGMMVVSEQARVAGAGSIPAPYTNGDNDGFFVYQPWHAGLFFSSASGFTEGWSRYSFDSKAMRKLEEGDAIVMMMENISAAHGAEYILTYRSLFKVH